MFNCGTLNDFKCTFSEHVGHVSMAMVGDEMSKVDLDNHETDLKSLKKEDNVHVTTDSIITTRKHNGINNFILNAYKRL